MPPSDPPLQGEATTNFVENALAARLRKKNKFSNRWAQKHKFESKQACSHSEKRNFSWSSIRSALTSEFTMTFLITHAIIVILWFWLVVAWVSLRSVHFGKARLKLPSSSTGEISFRSLARDPWGAWGLQGKSWFHQSAYRFRDV